jgi:hypothetical protein
MVGAYRVPREGPANVRTALAVTTPLALESNKSASTDDTRLAELSRFGTIAILIRRPA